LGAGQFCFLGVGGRDGVKAGDRFTIFRPYHGFNSQDMDTAGTGMNLTYSTARGYAYQLKTKGLLNERKLPPQILGDIIVIDAGDGVSAGKIVNSLQEIYPGDLIVKN